MPAAAGIPAVLAQDAPPLHTEKGIKGPIVIEEQLDHQRPAYKGADGKVVGGNGPPGLAFNPTETRSITGKRIIDLTEGAMPAGPGEVALYVSTAEKAGYEVGDTVTLVTPGKPPTIEAERRHSR